MKDYIKILLEILEEQNREYLGWEYFTQSERAMEAMEAMEAMARQALLLAREIYR